MLINAHTLAIINLVVQLLLIVAVLTAAYLVRIRKKFGVHCKILRILVPIQLASILIVMLPPMLSFIKNGQRGWLEAETLVHHSLGIIIILLWVLINLKFIGIVKIPIRLVILMRTAFILWILVLMLGVHLYTLFWS